MSDWRAGRDLLAARLRELPDALARATARGAPALGVANARRVVATGVGSSAAHAALLVHELRRAGRDAVVRPLSAFLAPPRPAPDEVLVVFSQGLSPNAHVALEAPRRWGAVVLATAVRDEVRLAPLRAAGIVVHPTEGEDEFGTLVRIVGPMAGYVAALQLAEALDGPPCPAWEPLATALATLAAPALEPDALEAPLGLVTSGTYRDVVGNLAAKVMEGMLLPLPPVWDAMELAHGPFQERVRERATFLALTRPEAHAEPELFDRFARMLDPERHRLVRLAATLPAPLALFEHEAMLNAIMLRYLEARAIDQTDWPGRGADAPLYALAAGPAERRLARLVWPALEPPPRTAILALGATEQHGPHLPFATDTLIAEALAVRLAARLDGAIALPALALGCSREHMSFPGTLDLAEQTLAAVVADVLRSLARHGVDETIVFSAHGGNASVLHAMAPAWCEAAGAMALHVVGDLAAVTRRLHAEAAHFGVAPEAAGHHAGEVETSIVLALDPGLVRPDDAAPGCVDPVADPQTLFYPDLRRRAPTGTVGDPCGAAALRGARYLDAWVDELERAYRAAKNRQ